HAPRRVAARVDDADRAPDDGVRPHVLLLEELEGADVGAPRAAPPPRMNTRFCRLTMGGSLPVPPARACNPATRPRYPAAVPLLLVDYESLLFRTFHTIPSSVPMHAVYGFVNMLARLVTDRRPDRLAIAVDEDWRPAFRVSALPSYKAHRVSDEPDPIAPQEALGRDLLAAVGIAVVGAEGYEAEDVIATPPT